MKICCDQSDEQGLLFQFSHKFLCAPFIKMLLIVSFFRCSFFYPMSFRLQKVGLEHSQGTLQAG